MGWVVKSVRPQALEALVSGEARESARAVVAAAEREARRLGRVAARETAAAAAYLDVLERLGDELRLQVAEQRGGLGDAGLAPAVPEPEPEPEPDEIRVHAASAAARPRGARASLRESPLAELFRVTSAG
jgi:hypothetical protein